MNIDKFVASLAATRKVYWDDMYAPRGTSRVLRSATEGTSGYVALDESVAYPQGGDQAGDRGTLSTASGKMQLDKVMLRQGVIIHHGKILEGTIQPDQVATIELDWRYRYANMRLHTLGHLIASAVWKVRPETAVLDSSMGRPCWLLLDGPLTDDDLRSIEAIVKHAVIQKGQVEPRFLDLEELKALCPHIPAKLPAKNLRAVFIDSFEPIPCGGTHVRSTEEVGDFSILDLESVDSKTFRLYFRIDEAGE